jgi:hypothetical protein
MDKKTILPIVILATILTVMPLVIGATISPTLNTPAAGTNNTGTLSFNCTLSADQKVLNASLWYNASGGAVDTMLVNVANDSASDTHFHSGSVSISSLSDLTTYNFSCLAANATSGEETWSTANDEITVDNTAPSVVVKIDEDSLSVGGIFHYTTTISDATSGVQHQSCNITDPESTITTASINVDNKLFDSDRLIDSGTWTLECKVSDYAGNTNSDTTTIKSKDIALPYKKETEFLQGLNKKQLIIIIVAIIVGIIIWQNRK